MKTPNLCPHWTHIWHKLVLLSDWFWFYYSYRGFFPFQKENCRPDGRELSEFRTTTLNIGETQRWSSSALYFMNYSVFFSIYMGSFSLFRLHIHSRRLSPGEGWKHHGDLRDQSGKWSPNTAVKTLTLMNLDQLNTFPLISCVSSSAGAGKPHGGGSWERLHRWVQYQVSSVELRQGMPGGYGPPFSSYYYYYYYYDYYVTLHEKRFFFWHSCIYSHIGMFFFKKLSGFKSRWTSLELFFNYCILCFMDI